MRYDWTPLWRSTIGFDRLFDVLDEVQRTAEESYPPYNIERLDENRFQISVALAGFTHARPDYAIDSIEIDGEPVPVEERGVMWTPFCQLLRFRKQGGENDPKILLIAPMSGHFATLLRDRAKSATRPVIHPDLYQKPTRGALHADYPASVLVSHAGMVL